MEDIKSNSNPKRGFHKQGRTSPRACNRRRSFRVRILRLLFATVLLTAAPIHSATTAWAADSPQRIISLSPGITEILFSLGAGDRLVGVTDFCSYPEAATRLPTVGGFLNPSFETIIYLQPDLIIHQPDSRNIEQFTRRMGIRSLVVKMFELEQIYQTILIVGEEVHRRTAAEELVDKIRGTIDRYQKRLADLKPKSVLLLLGVDKDSKRDLYAVGRGTFLGQLLALAGGENILPEASSLYPKISKEFIIQQSPEIIIEIGPKRILSGDELAKRRKGWQIFPSIRAVKENNIHFVGGDYLLKPGPRLINIIDHFIQAIHPEVFLQVDSQVKTSGALHP